MGLAPRRSDGPFPPPGAARHVAWRELQRSRPHRRGSWHRLVCGDSTFPYMGLGWTELLIFSLRARMGAYFRRAAGSVSAVLALTESEYRAKQFYSCRSVPAEGHLRLSA